MTEELVTAEPRRKNRILPILVVVVLSICVLCSMEGLRSLTLEVKNEIIPDKLELSETCYPEIGICLGIPFDWYTSDRIPANLEGNEFSILFSTENINKSDFYDLPGYGGHVVLIGLPEPGEAAEDLDTVFNRQVSEAFNYYAAMGEPQTFRVDKFPAVSNSYIFTQPDSDRMFYTYSEMSAYFAVFRHEGYIIKFVGVCDHEDWYDNSAIFEQIFRSIELSPLD
jgi:hypothetical protein